MRWHRIAWFIVVPVMVSAWPASASHPAAGTGLGGNDAQRTVAEVQARYEATRRRCEALTVVAVRLECLKVAQAQRKRELARLSAAKPP